MATLSASRPAVLPCSCSYFVGGAPASRRAPAVRRARLAVAVRAQEDGSPPPPPSQQQADEDRRMEALEASARARKGIKAEQAEAMRPSRPSRATDNGGMPEWKEGQLFPEGWEEMDPFTKASQLYMGKRGFLFWAVESAKYSVGGLIVGWALFRFVGPALGLYKLANDLSNPNLL